MKLKQLQQESDKSFDEKWTNVMRWSDDYADREADGSSALQIKYFLHLQLQKAYNLGLQKGVEMVDVDEICCDSCRTEILTSINKIKEEIIK